MRLRPFGIAASLDERRQRVAVAGQFLPIEMQENQGRGGGNAFVAVDEAMVFCQTEQQGGRLFDQTGLLVIGLLEGTVDGTRNQAKVADAELTAVPVDLIELDLQDFFQFEVLDVAHVARRSKAGP